MTMEEYEKQIASIRENIENNEKPEELFNLKPETLNKVSALMFVPGMEGNVARRSRTING